jgi:hypothetical protein
MGCASKVFILRSSLGQIAAATATCVLSGGRAGRQAGRQQQKEAFTFFFPIPTPTNSFFMSAHCIRAEEIVAAAAGIGRMDGSSKKEILRRLHMPFLPTFLPSFR